MACRLEKQQFELHAARTHAGYMMPLVSLASQVLVDPLVCPPTPMQGAMDNGLLDPALPGAALAGPALPVAAPEPALENAADHDDLGPEDAGKTKMVYLVTFSHPRDPDLKAPGDFTRQEILDAILKAVEDTQGSRLTPLRMKYITVFQERHGNGEVHYHVGVRAERGFRFNTVKQRLLMNHGLASHWSCSHDTYASCVAYGYMPSPKKPRSELDASPLAWAVDGAAHPPLEEASRPRLTAAALQQRREHVRRDRAEMGKTEKFKALDLWPIVVRENISPDAPDCADKVVAYAARCGGQAMVEYCFNNYTKLEELVARCWRMEKVEDHIAEMGKPRMQFVEEASRSPCACGGRWVPAARQLNSNGNGQSNRNSASVSIT